MALSDGLISFWELEESTGTGARVDAHSGGNNLDPTDNAGAAVSVAQGAGLVGNAAELSGANQLRHAAVAGLDLGDVDFTLAGWLYLPASVPSGSYGLAAKGAEFALTYTAGAGNEYVGFVWSPDATPVETDYPDTLNGTLDKDAWHFVAMRHDADNDFIRLRVGPSASTAVPTGGSYPTDLTGPFKLGYAGAEFAGAGFRLDQVGYWQRHLSDAELDTLYHDGAGLSYAALVPPPAFTGSSLLPAPWDFALRQGATFQRILTWKDDAGEPIDLTDYTARMQIRATRASSAVLLELTTENGRLTLGGLAGTITLSLGAAETAEFDWTVAVYDLEMVVGATVLPLVEGSVTLRKEVTR